MPPFSQRTADAILWSIWNIPLIRPANMKMSDPSQDPNSWIAMWHSLPDTLRASILGLLLALIMAFKNDGRTLGERITDVLATPVLVVISGYSLQAMGFSESLVFVLAGVFAGYGIGPVKAVLKRWLEKKVDAA